MRAFILARLREPSTWLGIWLAASHLPTAIAASDWQAVGAVVGGILGAILPERGKQ